jgi:hypothetical protein
MKAYTAFLDMLTIFFLVLAINFNLTGDHITGPVGERRGAVSIMVISWQTFFAVAGFCVFLRYIARKVA